jgi:primosomal protein N' (replication factor Y)
VTEPAESGVLEVAVPAPVAGTFDYLPPAGVTVVCRQGQRVRVPFGRGTRIGVIVGLKATSDLPASRLKHAAALLDAEPLLPADLLAMLLWAQRYYHHPVGDVVATALPAALRSGASPDATEEVWLPTTAGVAVAGPGSKAAAALARSPGQRRVLAAIAAAPGGFAGSELGNLPGDARRLAALLEQRGLVTRGERPTAALPAAAGVTPETPPDLNADQAAAVAVIQAARGFATFLLDGVTGSGKTEVYLQAIAPLVAAGRQCLVLVPEISLTPQLVARFRRRFPAGVVEFHSGLTDAERLRAWAAARRGEARLVIGTRSAIFVPLVAPGLIVVDEEHDASYKQQEGFRYSARDLAVWRARALGVPLVLGSATPSLESIENAKAGRYQRLALPARAGSAGAPSVALIDLRRHPPTDGLSEPLRAAIARHLAAGGQALLYLNRRGFAPTLLCPDCGAVAGCERCDARMVLHQRAGRLECHHCGATRPVPTACAACGGEFVPVGLGTERIEAALQRAFPDEAVVRIDRDTVRRRGELGRQLERVRSGEARLLMGTQMLTKGHDFPGVTLVGIIDADQGLFGTDFRSSERLAQSFIQVAGRAGRADRPGEVLLQTLFPDHPLLRLLVGEGYVAFASAALEERQAAGWPPFASLALLRAEAVGEADVFRFLDAARALAGAAAGEGVRILGPAPAAMARRSGRHRGQLLLQAAARQPLHRLLGWLRPQLDALPDHRRVRWSIDVDPVELF